MSAAADNRASELREEAAHYASEAQRGAASDARRLLECIDALERVTTETLEALRREMDLLHTEISRCLSPLERSPGSGEPASLDRGDEPFGSAPDEEQGEAAQAEVIPEAEEEEPEQEALQEDEPEQESLQEDEPEQEALQEDEPEDAVPEETGVVADEEEYVEPIEAGAEPVEDEAQQASVHDETAPDRPAPAGPRRRRGLLRRLVSRRRGRPFIDTAGECAVCGQGLVVDSEEELAESGWRVRGETGVCPVCQLAGWDLREDGTVPSADG
jgi:hypothetical protein